MTKQNQNLIETVKTVANRIKMRPYHSQPMSRDYTKAMEMPFRSFRYLAETPVPSIMQQAFIDAVARG